MLENEPVPFTMIKENNVGTLGNQCKWTKTKPAEDMLKYVIENITILQEPTETLSMNITLLREMKFACRQNSYFSCNSCHRQIYAPQASCQNIVGNIYYDLRIGFHNYLHEFSSSYSYEVVCKILRENKPDEYLFTSVQPRSEKTVEFKKCYLSTEFNRTFNFSSSTLYFGIRRLNNRGSETRISNLLSVISLLQNMDDEGNSKVFLQARGGQILVHKSVLSQYSDVFRAMFSHDMSEMQDGVVEIPDVELEVIQKMVDYLYTGELENITGMTEKLFKVAHQYQIPDLCRRCEEYYIFNVQPTNDNIVGILHLVDLYELKELKNGAEKFVRCHKKNLVKLPRYQNYLCESLNIANATDTLVSADKYNMIDVKTSALEFIKHNFDKMVNCDDFLKLFDSNSRLMKEVYVFSFHKNV